MTDTVEERLARVETSLNHVLDELRRLTEKLDHMDDRYVPRREFDDFKAEVNSRRAPIWIILGLIATVILGVFNIVPKG